MSHAFKTCEGNTKPIKMHRPCLRARRFSKTVSFTGSGSAHCGIHFSFCCLFARTLLLASLFVYQHLFRLCDHARRFFVNSLGCIASATAMEHSTELTTQESSDRSLSEWKEHLVLLSNASCFMCNLLTIRIFKTLTFLCRLGFI